MKLRVFHADDGDCLLLTAASGDHRVLVDGGRSQTFRTHTLPTLEALAKNGTPLDLVIVSHVDNDHISGILKLVERTIQWIVHDHQTGDGANPDHDPPSGKRPPAIIDLWHNSWQDRYGTQLGTQIQELVTAVSTAVELSGYEFDRAGTVGKHLRTLDQLALGATEGRRLLDISAGNIPRNRQFAKLVRLESPPVTLALGSMQLTVLGPMQKHIDAMRTAWRDFFKVSTGGGRGPDASVRELLEPKGGLSFANAVAAGGEAAVAASRQLLDSLATAARTIEDADPGAVTPWNRASITVLAEEDDDAGRTRSCLLTGDAAAEELLEGLGAAGRIDNGRFRCNVLKVQHHGALDNLSEQFAKTVIADQYVFCANGSHHNPELAVVKELLARRLETDSSPFKVWFNSSPDHVEAGARRDALKRAIAAAQKFERDHPSKVTVKVIGAGKSYVDLRV
jgi:beta-lactamase superfamily II metal-dependent hydrolase